MGGGSWTPHDWDKYSVTSGISSSTATAKTIYKAKKLKDTYDPLRITLRESRDSTDNPNSTAICVALDVTGSMNNILTAVAKRLGDLVKEIYDKKPVSDPQVMFMAVGDCACHDEAPLQVTQYESDIRIAEQLTDLWFEGGGGGNDSESYTLPWYFLSHRTSIDCFEKRQKKGFLFTMGDDGPPRKISPEEIARVFGDKIPQALTTEELLDQVSRQYEVFHLILAQGSNHSDTHKERWDKLLGERAIVVTDYEKLPEIICSLLRAIAGESKDKIIGSYDGSTALVVATAIKDLKIDTVSSGGVVKFD